MTWQTAVAYQDDEAVITVAGEIDTVSEAELREAVEGALRHDPAPTEITIDLSQVSFLDSAGIRGLLVSHSAASERGARLRVRHPQPIVATVLQVTRVNALLGLQLPPECDRPSRPR